MRPVHKHDELMAKRIFQLTLALLLATAVTSCSTTGKKKDENPDAKPEKMYQQGMKYLEKKNYEIAIEAFDKIQARYPFGKYAQLAQLQTAYAHLKLDEPDAAIVAADQFIKLNPQHEKVDFAYYIKATANATRYRGLLDGFFEKDLGELDPNPLRQAFADYKQLIRRFPDSPYVDEARQRMIFLRNALAKHEYNVAEFYSKRGAWVAVINRCKDIVRDYDGSEIMPETLALMAHAYKKLDMNDAYEETIALFKANYPKRTSLLKEGWRLFN